MDCIDKVLVPVGNKHNTVCVVCIDDDEVYTLMCISIQCNLLAFLISMDPL